MTESTRGVINRFSSVATDPLRSFRFVAEFLTPKQGGGPVDPRITGFVGGFTQISGLGINTQSIAYREGGYNTTIHQIPGMTTFNPISFNRGVIFGNAQGIDWMRTLFAAAAGDGIALGGKDFRCDVKIYVLDHPAAANATPTRDGEGGQNTPKMAFHVHNAWISTLNYSDLDAGGNNIMVETIGLVHEGLSVFFTDKNFNTLPVLPRPTF
jgi:phage tail-like protein